MEYCGYDKQFKEKWESIIKKYPRRFAPRVEEYTEFENYMFEKAIGMRKDHADPSIFILCAAEFVKDKKKEYGEKIDGVQLADSYFRNISDRYFFL